MSVFADPNHVAAATRTHQALRLDHLFDPRELLRQRDQRAGPARRALLALLLVPGIESLADLDDRDLDILQRQRQLVGIQLLRARAELRALELLHQPLEGGPQRLLIGELRLDMPTCRALHLERLALHLEGPPQIRRKLSETCKIK